MKLVIAKDYEDLSKQAARLIAEEVTRHPSTILGLATGGTPVGMYQELIALHKEEGVDFSQATSFNLDEYVGLPGHHPQSYRTYMEDNLFTHINLPTDKTNIPRGDAADLGAECKRYEQAIEASGGIDIQVLGIGNNGHIGFNEPGSTKETTTRVVQLTESTIQANARYFDKIEEVPTQAVSMGIQTILGAKKIILLASGKAKAEAVHSMLEGKMTPDVPASLLQQHPNVTVIVDEEAASALSVKTRN
ncbi:glucosamine-6-phosphate deaminase [Brevibacillus choshinensis]|uniref:glucosamine-6-phosphate deaminase n=1 Tax=Brevibacillus choshinensis TaxID=54911 RepID=UPI002E216696|nr:glucosamine-6-phosphate deaminase [Brevibacillus choshinensis]MED4587037.1 glucosamine-6-phosphate deaminase [Brevibacillus choshinensis]MED4754824.1 glucosamine-6-phosphate deaminase [Brevibacillus choshinensis]MED4784814.1 glucosamine-6-phosphate deaminase [Brevibacillus choshinensis]